jgi:CRP-like cAMP-binding protein
MTEKQKELVKKAFAKNPVMSTLKDVEALLSDPGFTLCTYSSGEVIFTPSSYKKAFAVVASGSINVSKDSGQSRIVMKKTVAGGGFGAAALFGNTGEYASTVTAMEKNTVVAMIDEEAMIRLMGREPHVSIAYISFLSDRIRYLNTRIDTFASGSAGTRLIRFLLAESPCEISMQRLSEVLGVSRVTLYREMEKLEESGAVAREGKHILVTDKRLLENLL